MAKTVLLLVLNFWLLYNANATYYDPTPFHHPSTSISHQEYVYTTPSHHHGYFYLPPKKPILVCEPPEPVIVDCVDSPIDSSCQITATNENGTCFKEADCPTFERVMNYTTPPVCGYDGESKLVCCPPPDEENRARSRRPRPTNEGTVVREMPVPIGGGPISEEMCMSFYEDAPRAKRDTTRKRFKRDNFNQFDFNPHHINTFAADSYLPPPSPPKKRACIRTTTTTTTTPAPETTTTPPDNAVSPAFATRAQPNAYPYMAAIGFPNGPGVLNFLCGGFLVDPCYVITSAHCLVEGTPTHVRVGGVSLRDKSIQNTDLPIDPNGITPHPNYDPLQQYNDIAVLRLGTCAPTSIRPACLWTERFVGYENLTALGYGLTEGGGTSDDLLEVDLTLYNNDFCQNVFGSRSNRRRRGITDEHLCAGRPLGDDAAYYDTCDGDSGGPIGATRERLFSGIPVPYVMGVTQFGRGCGITPAAIYARVSSHIGWLESVIWPNGRSSQ